MSFMYSRNRSVQVQTMTSFSLKKNSPQEAYKEIKMRLPNVLECVNVVLSLLMLCGSFFIAGDRINYNLAVNYNLAAKLPWRKVCMQVYLRKRFNFVKKFIECTFSIRFIILIRNQGSTDIMCVFYLWMVRCSDLTASTNVSTLKLVVYTCTRKISSSVKCQCWSVLFSKRSSLPRADCPFWVNIRTKSENATNFSKWTMIITLWSVTILKLVTRRIWGKSVYSIFWNYGVTKSKFGKCVHSIF